MSDNDLIHLVYTSKACWPMQQQDLTDILTTSRANNACCDVTGLLLYNNSSFLQLLEGPQRIVRDLYYDKICCDSRHKNVTLLFEKQMQGRLFPNWQMGFKNIERVPSIKRPGFLSLDDQSFTAMLQRHHSSVAYALLLAFKSSASAEAVA